MQTIDSEITEPQDIEPQFLDSPNMEPQAVEEQQAVEKKDSLGAVFGYTFWGVILAIIAWFVYQWLHPMWLKHLYDSHVSEIKHVALMNDRQSLAKNISSALSEAKALNRPDDELSDSLAAQARSYLDREEFISKSEELNAAALLAQASLEMSQTAQSPQKAKIVDIGILLARAQVASGQTEAGQRTLEKFLAIATNSPSCLPQYVEILYLLSDLYEKQSQLEMAQKLLEKASFFCVGHDYDGNHKLLSKSWPNMTKANWGDWTVELPMLDEQFNCLKKLEELDKKLGQVDKASLIQQRIIKVLEKMRD